MARDRKKGADPVIRRSTADGEQLRVEVNGQHVWVNQKVLNGALQDIAFGNDGKHYRPMQDEVHHTLKPANFIRLTIVEQEAMLRQFKDAVDVALSRLTEPMPASPPRPAEILLIFFCGAETQEAVLGDLDERFHQLVERQGRRFARSWYWWQAIRSLSFFAFTWARRLLELDALIRRIF